MKTEIKASIQKTLQQLQLDQFLTKINDTAVSYKTVQWFYFINYLQ